jgi:hypothetical protein
VVVLNIINNNQASISEYRDNETVDCETDWVIPQKYPTEKLVLVVKMVNYFPVYKCLPLLYVSYNNIVRQDILFYRMLLFVLLTAYKSPNRIIMAISI